MKEESIQQYFLIMKEIASKGNIKDDSLMEYVIDGVDDESVNKSILYGAETIKEFKIKLCHFERMKEKTTAKVTRDKDLKKSNKDSTTRTEQFKDRNKTNHCYNCGDTDHKSAECKNKNKGRKCFKCNKFGHISKECNEK